MLLIGTTNLTRTDDVGEFHCPTCGSRQEYRLRARTPFLTLYFVPMVPIGGTQRFVRCGQCCDHWDTSVLDIDLERQEAIQLDQFHEEVLHAAVLVVLADGSMSDGEIETLQLIACHLFQRVVDREELGERCSIAEQNRISADNYLLTVSRRWSQTQRSFALQAIFLAASADGSMGTHQSRIISRLRETFEMTDQEYQSAIEESFEWELV